MLDKPSRPAWLGLFLLFAIDTVAGFFISMLATSNVAPADQLIVLALLLLIFNVFCVGVAICHRLNCMIALTEEAGRRLFANDASQKPAPDTRSIRSLSPV